MDRQIVYPGSIPLDTDLLNIQRHVMASLGALTRAVFGETGVVDGLDCGPAGGEAYGVVVGPGSYSAPLAKDFAAFGSLPADPTIIMQTALHEGNTLLRLGPPPQANQVICWLIQAQITTVDAGPVALPYWNAANPMVAFSGPANSGLAQNTQRVLQVVLSSKPSAPQPYPSGTPPNADAGWIGLYSVTTFAGKPGIEIGDIIPIVTVPSLRYKLLSLPPAPVQQQTFILDTLWRAPRGVQQVRVRLVGAGGGGGGGDAGFSGGGGGAGGFAESLVKVMPGQVYSVIVGQGGAPGVTGSTGGTGGSTAFDTFVHASGGEGGASANPDSHGGAPGVGTLGGLLQGGGYGGDGAVVASIPGGTGGASVFGGGGRGADQGGVPAVGRAAGSGGGGGYGAKSPGGAGATGLVIIEY